MRYNKITEEVVAPGITATYMESASGRSLFPIGVRFNPFEMQEGSTFTVYKKNGQIRLEAGNRATEWVAGPIDKENQTSLL